MQIIKKMFMSFLLLAQIHGAVAASADYAQVGVDIPETITLVCDDGERIERVNVRFLMENFGFFESYFSCWARCPSVAELRIHGSVDDIVYLLASVRNLSRRESIPLADEPRSAVSLLIVADRFLLKKELMGCLKEQYGDVVSKELHSKPFYEKFLRGDREAIACAWAIDKRYTPAPIFEPKFEHSTAGFEEDQCDRQTELYQQKAAKRQAQLAKQLAIEAREEKYEIKRQAREEEHRRSRHQINEDSRRTLHAILSLPYYPAPYYPSTYVPAYSQPSYNQSVQISRPSSSLFAQQPRPRPQTSLFDGRESQLRRGLYSFKEDYTSETRPVQQETVASIFSRTRVKPTVFSEDRMRGVGFSDMRIYVYDDAEHLLLEHSFSLGKCRQGYVIGEVRFEGPDKLEVLFHKKVPNETSYYIRRETVYLPSYEIVNALAACTDEERYLYHVLKSRAQEVGHTLDRLSLSPELEATFDRLPRNIRSEILTKEGRIERVLAKRVEDIHRKMKEYSNNKCRDIQVYEPR